MIKSLKSQHLHDSVIMIYDRTWYDRVLLAQQFKISSIFTVRNQTGSELIYNTYYVYLNYKSIDSKKNDNNLVSVVMLNAVILKKKPVSYKLENVVKHCVLVNSK